AATGAAYRARAPARAGSPAQAAAAPRPRRRDARLGAEASVGLNHLRRPAVMGVVNVTPDSFSDGGDFFEPAAAIAHGRRLLAEGADLVDVGGESTRPGAEPVGEAVELERVMPVIEELGREGVPLSIDTSKAA